MWSFTSLETIWEDLRYSARLLLKSPGAFPNNLPAFAEKLYNLQSPAGGPGKNVISIRDIVSGSPVDIYRKDQSCGRSYGDFQNLRRG